MDILVVDDEASSRTLLAMMLGSLGCTVAEAANGKEAIEAVRSSAPDLVLIDQIMPEMFGYDAMLAIRDLEGFDHLPFVMITTSYDVQERQDKDELKCCAFIPKPFSREQLFSAIRVATGRKFPPNPPTPA
ncbi:MAG: response regulator [Elusimicrobiota bacterium]